MMVRSDEDERVDDLIKHGQKMVEVGYLAGARAYFKRAAEAGSGEAAVLLGATYELKSAPLIPQRKAASESQSSLLILLHQARTTELGSLSTLMYGKPHRRTPICLGSRQKAKSFASSAGKASGSR
jgi:hypothetical protein